MEIRTKFKYVRTKFEYGSIIYTLKRKEIIDKNGHIHISWYIIKTKVDFIMIGYNGKNLGIRYTYDLYWEQDCFATKEEAQKECERRNGK